MTLSPTPGSPQDPAPVISGSAAPTARPLSLGLRVADVSVSLILMVAGGVGFAILAYFALLSAFVADACYGQCDTELLTVGWLISLFAPPVIFVSTIIWTVFRLVTRRSPGGLPWPVPPPV